MGWGSFLCWSWNVKEKGRFGSHSFSSVLCVQGGFWKGQFSLLHHMTLHLRRPPGIQTNQNKTAAELELSAHGDWQRERESHFELLWSVLWHIESQLSGSERFHPAIMPDLIILKDQSQGDCGDVFSSWEIPLWWLQGRLTLGWERVFLQLLREPFGRSPERSW